MATEQQTLIGRLILRAEGWSAGIKSAEKSMERFGTSMFFMGSRITASVTVPLVALAAAVVKVGADFDQAMTESLAIIDKVTPQMRRQMEDTAKRVATTTKFSAQEAAEAYFFLASSGMSAAESMRALPVVANFAQAGVINLAKATELLSDAYITLGLRTGDASQRMRNMQRVADVLTEANNMAQGSIEEFAEALTNRAGVAMRVFGISVEEGVAALAAFAERGIKGKKAGQQLFIVIRDLQRAALKNREEWERLVGKGAVFDEVTGELKNLADIIGALEIALAGLSDRQVKSTLDMLGFQERSLQATLTLIGASERMREFEEAFRSAGGVVDRVAKKQMVSFTNQMHIVRERISQVGITLFDTFRPAFEQVFLPLVRRGIDSLEELGKWLGKTSIETRGWMLTTGAAVAVLGPLLTIAGGLTLFIRPLAPAFRGLNKVFILLLKGLNGIVPAVVGLKVAFVGLSIAFFAKLALGISAVVAAVAAFRKVISLLNPGLGTVREQLHANVVGYDMLSRELEDTLGLYSELRTKTDLTSRELERMGEIEEVLATSVGLTTGAFREQFGATSELKDLFEEEIQTLKDLEAAQLNQAAVAVQAAMDQVNALDRQIAALAGGAPILKQAMSNWDHFWNIIDQGGRIIVYSLQIAWEVVKAFGGVILEEFANAGRAVADFFAEWLGLEVFAQGILNLIDNLTASLEGMSKWFTKTADSLQQIATGKTGSGGQLEDHPALAAQIKLTEERNAAQSKYVELLSELELLQSRFTGALEGTNNELENGRSTADGFEDSLGKLGDGFSAGIETTKVFRDKVADLLKLLRGLGNDNLPILTRAFSLLTAAELKNAGVIERLWDAYEPLRKNLDPSEFPAEIESLTKALREQDEWTKFLTTDAGKFVAAMTQVERKYIDIIDHSEDVAKAWEEMGGALPDRFFEEHGDTIQTLMIDYAHLVDGPIRDVIDAYVEWATSSEQTSQKLKKIWADNSKWIKEKSEDMVATLASKQAELSIFSLATSDQELIGLKKGYEERKLAHNRMIEDMVSKMAFLEGEQLETAEAQLNKARENGAKIILIDEKIGLLRLAKARGFSNRMIELMGEMMAGEIEELIEGKTEQEEIMRKFRDRMLVAGNLGALFEQMGGRFAALGAFIRAVSSDIDAFGAAAVRFKDAETAAQHAAAGIGMATAALSAWQKIAQIEGKGKRAAAGAATGAQMGSAFGPWGVAIGAGVGAIAGFLMDDPGWTKVRDAIRDRFQVNVSDELAKAIEKTAEEVGDDFGAMLLHLNDIIDESGGVTAANVDHWTSQVRDAFSATEFGALTLAEATEVLDENFGSLVEAGTLSSGVLKANIVELITLNEEFGTGSAAIRDYVSSMMDLAGEGLSTFAQGVGVIREGLVATFEASMESAKEFHDAETAAMVQKAKDADASDEEIALIQQRQQDRWANITAEMQLAFRNDFMSKTQEDWADLTDFTEMSFLAMIGSGMSFLEALEKLDPSLEELQAMIDITGLKGSEAIDQLLRIRQFKIENEGLILQIQGMNDLMVGLANSGNMTQESFTRFGGAAVRQFDRLIESGLSSNDAILLMAPSLQVIKDLSEQYGFTVDENTQRLIDLATEQGNVGDKARTTDEILSQGLLAVAEGIGVLITLFGGDLPESIIHLSDIAEQETEGIGEDMTDMRIKSNREMDLLADHGETRFNDIAADAERATGEAERNFENLRRNANQELGNINVPDLDITSDVGVNIHWNYDEFQMPGGDHVQLMQHGGIISRPSLIVGGEGGEPEMIGPVGFMSEALRGALGNSGQGQNEVVSELQSLREEMELLPIHIRDAIITSQ